MDTLIAVVVVLYLIVPVMWIYKIFGIKIDGHEITSDVLFIFTCIFILVNIPVVSMLYYVLESNPNYIIEFVKAVYNEI